MKKISTIFSIILLIVFIVGLLLYGLKHSSYFQEKLIRSGASFSKEILALNQEIDNSSPEDTSEKRIVLFN